MVVASAEGLDHDVAQGGLGQVAIPYLLGAALVMGLAGAPCTLCHAGSYVT